MIAIRQTTLYSVEHLVYRCVPTGDLRRQPWGYNSYNKSFSPQHSPQRRHWVLVGQDPMMHDSDTTDHSLLCGTSYAQVCSHSRPQMPARSWLVADSLLARSTWERERERKEIKKKMNSVQLQEQQFYKLSSFGKIFTWRKPYHWHVWQSLQQKEAIFNYRSWELELLTP